MLLGEYFCIVTLYVEVTAKKPRLATRSQFLSDQSDDESDMDDCSSQQSVSRTFAHN